MLRWLQEGKDHREYYGRRILLYRWARIQGRIPMFEKEEKRAYRRFLSRVKMPRHPMLQGWKKVAWAAMLVCALGTGGVWWYEASQGQVLLLVQTVEVPEGVKQRMVLADGTKVWLNSGSRLTLDAGFGQTNRGLQLEGEGMFEVAKDGRLPFIIRSGDIRVRVTGTVFNFKAYPEERFAKVTLLQGSLDVYEENGEVFRSVRMAPHEQVVVDREKDVMEKSTAEAAPDMAWASVEHAGADGAGNTVPEDAARDLVFDEMSMEDIVRRLEQVFGVDIVVNAPGLLRERYYGDFRGKDDIFDILDVMLRGEPMTYRIKGDTIYIEE